MNKATKAECWCIFYGLLSLALQNYTAVAVFVAAFITISALEEPS